ncbi:MAG: bifunctional glutamate N-acetyltransferase/amino-acid acetyltransferase ArgJ [Paracoccaceae bacterium]|nr:bifunctional glutamate N-acetyltransferase/amino-acid acetyltransferase ArgJ [Paracoccaceae bacterium]
MNGNAIRSPLAPLRFPDLPVIGGVQFANAASGIGYSGRDDVMLALLAPGSVVAGVFTRSATRSASVLDCQEKIGLPPEGGAAIIVNSGNANAFTGQTGVKATEAVTQNVAEVLDLAIDRVFSSSTGVIGEPLPYARIVAALPDLKQRLDPTAIKGAAEAIMTTDTFAKGASGQIERDGKQVRIAGIAKGSGMIAPDMATMLVYIFTDAQIDQADLQSMVQALSDVTFNCITVDSDTSTSDSLLVAATGASRVPIAGTDDEFRAALYAVMRDLAHQVVRDGEGASKFVEIEVSGAATAKEARIHAMAIANSPLVKTAIAGEDPNWGRVVMAIGKSGAAANRDLLTIQLGDILVAENGWVAPDYDEDQATAYMTGDELRIAVDLGLGAGNAVVWTCDLTHRYIEINADYRS